MSLAGTVPNGCPPPDPRAVVALTGVASGVSAHGGPIPLSLGRCGFDPRVSAGEEGSVLQVKAGPDHRIEAWQGGVRVFDAAASGDAGFVLPTPGVWKVRCAAGHPGEEAWVYVVPHPYAATTRADGSFYLGSVPVGRYTVVAWAPPDLSVSRPVEVLADRVTDLTLIFPP